MFADSVSVRSACALVAVWVLIQPIAGMASPYASGKDNSGRQIAQVIPGMPPPVAPVVAVPVNVNPTAAVHAYLQKQQHEEGVQKHRLSSEATPVQLSPEAKQALATGVMAAQGLSRIAVKRISDVGTWVAVLFRDLDSVPRVTPAETFAMPRIPVDKMHPIAEPDKSQKQLYYTSEDRLRTVVGR